MIIKKLHLIGFGHFTNTELTLDNNYNLIVGSNEYGKTTLFAFIRAMIFGLKGNKKDQIHDYERYMPIDNPHNYRGIIFLSINNINYKIERNFHRDTRSVKILDIDNNKNITEKKFLELISPIDFDTFSNTCYINSETTKPGDLFMKILQEKIIGMVETNSSDLLVSTTVNSLNKKIKSYKSKIKDLPIFNDYELVSKKDNLKDSISNLNLEIDKSIEKSKINILIPIIALLTIVATITTFFIQFPRVLSIVIIIFTILFLLFCIFKYKQKYSKEKEEFLAKEQLIWKKNELVEIIEKIDEDLITSKKIANSKASYQNEIKALELAVESITAIAKELCAKNTNEFNKRLTEIFSAITNNTFKGVFINEDMKIYGVREDNALYPLINFSKGTLEQLYLALRMVAIDFIYPNHSLPIIIDDIFVHYDYKRYLNTMSVLEKCNHQVIIFTLTKSVL